MVRFVLNGNNVRLDGDDTTPLLWVLRDELGLYGTRYGCGIGACGACTVHVNGQPQRSCILPIGGLEGASVTTIEGLSETGDHPVQQAWLALDVAQCGYCQSGQIMAAAALLSERPNPTDTDINNAMTNLCRCGTYVRVRKAIHHAAAIASNSEKREA